MFLALLSACGHDVEPVVDVESECTTDKLGDGGDFFDPSVLHEVRITVPDAGLSDLRDNPREYTVADVKVDGTPLHHVGVRLKGSSSFQEFDGKPAFKLKLNEYCPGQKYAGLKRITLNNMVSDPTESQEVINYQVWAAAGLKAPRASYAQV